MISKDSGFGILAFAVVCLLVCAAAPVAAAPQAFDWSYTGLNGYTVLASGTLVATPLGGGVYQVTSISGTRNGLSITVLRHMRVTTSSFTPHSRSSTIPASRSPTRPAVPSMSFTTPALSTLTIAATSAIAKSALAFPEQAAWAHHATRTTRSPSR